MKSILEAPRSHTLKAKILSIFFISNFHNIIILVSCEEEHNYGNSTMQEETTFLLSNDTTIVIPKSELSDLQSSVAPPAPVFQDDDMSQWNGKEWLYKKELKGYLIVSNDLRFLTKLLHRRKILKIRIPLSSARITEKLVHRRDVEIKASTWNKISRVKIRVPYGFTPQELRVIEKPTMIDIYAPYSFIEFEGESSETPKKKYKPSNNNKLIFHLS